MRARVWSTFGLGGFAYRVGVDPEDPFRASVACGDGSLRSLDLHLRGGGDVLWRGLPQTKATCAAGAPRRRRMAKGTAVASRWASRTAGSSSGRRRSGTVRGAEGLPAGSCVMTQWIKRSGRQPPR